MLLDRLSRRMAVITLWLVILMLTLNAAYWLFPQSASALEGFGLAFSLSDRLISSLQLDIGNFPWWQRLGAILLSSFPLLALSFGLLSLRALFKSYAAGEYFSDSSAAHTWNVWGGLSYSGLP